MRQAIKFELLMNSKPQRRWGSKSLRTCSLLINPSLPRTWAASQGQRDPATPPHRHGRLQAEATATKISQFFQEIEGQMGSTTELTWPDATLEQQRSQFARMLRQLPAITELAQLDASGREQLLVLVELPVEEAK
jgi:hypothetical protein